MLPPLTSRPSAVGRVADQLGDPAHRLELDLGRHRRERASAPTFGLTRGGEQVAQRADRRRRRGDVAEEARVPVEERVLEQQRHGLVEKRAAWWPPSSRASGKREPAAHSAPRPFGGRGLSTTPGRPRSRPPAGARPPGTPRATSTTGPAGSRARSSPSSPPSSARGSGEVSDPSASASNRQRGLRRRRMLAHELSGGAAPAVAARRAVAGDGA